MTGRIMITPRSLSRGDHPALAPLHERGFELVYPSPGATPTEADLIDTIGDCVGWIAGVEPVSEDVIKAATSLRVISRNGTGVDNLPLSALERRGIAVCRAEGANARGVAELALSLCLAGFRDVVNTHNGIRAGGWPRRIGRELRNARVGVVGLGAIGASFARFALALGGRVSGYDPFAPRTVVDDPHFSRTDLDDVLRGANAVSLHAPLPANNRPMIGRQELALLARGAVVVNTARAGLIDDDAMLEALQSGQVGAFAADVFHSEPPVMTALLRHPNVILTSHIGGFTAESVERATSRAVENLLEALDSAMA
jgi:phosphoglycerate dehydrogenase-like enzyme